MKTLIQELFSQAFLEGTHSRFNIRIYIRTFKRYFQRFIRGWDDSDIWNLNHTAAEFLLPRLKLFKEKHHGYPMGLSEETWEAEIDKMILAFDLIIKDNYSYSSNNEKIDEGLQSFAKYFRNLWD